jgi:hypothetical protein
MHITSALAGVQECDRCEGWQSGVCPEINRRKAAKAGTVTTASGSEVGADADTAETNGSTKKDCSLS